MTHVNIDGNLNGAKCKKIQEMKIHNQSINNMRLLRCYRGRIMPQGYFSDSPLTKRDMDFKLCNIGLGVPVFLALASALAKMGLGPAKQHCTFGVQT